MTFTEVGAVAGTVLLSHAGGILAVDIPYGVYHTAISLESGTVFYETKAGPYRQLTEDETVAWAPEESNPEAQYFLQRLRSLFD